MARLQILELPEGSGDDRPPFVLVVDECMPQRIVVGLDSSWQDHWQQLADKIGARGVLVFDDTIDIPANEITLTHVQEAADGNVVRLRVEPDLTGFTDTVMAEAVSAQTKVVEAVGQNQGDRKAALTDALGMDRLRDWDDIRNAVAGIRRDCDDKAEAIERVRRLHQPVEHRGKTICWECSDYDFPGQTTDSAPVAYEQCGTLRALNGNTERSPEE
ncbi:hypothetical protein [Streptomyces sp. NPDC005780]|uniref:hypothetical protein n=1 Tax=Streptomyces sp. NPDC005780 TaxID=3364730 RepID=UPI003691FC2A